MAIQVSRPRRWRFLLGLILLGSPTYVTAAVLAMVFYAFGIEPAVAATAA